MTWGSFGWGGFSSGKSYSFGGKSHFGGKFSSWTNKGWTYDSLTGCGGKSRSRHDDDDDDDDGKHGWSFGRGRDKHRDDDDRDRDDDDDRGGRGRKWWDRDDDDDDDDDDDRGGRGRKWWDRDDDDDDRGGCGRDDDDDDDDDGGDGGGDGGGDTGGGSAEKVTVDFTLGDSQQLTFEVSQTEEGSLFFKVVPTSWDSEETDIDGIFMNLTDDSTAEGLNIHPDENAIPLTNKEVAPDAVNSLSDGTTLSENFDIGLQFGQSPDSTDGYVDNLSFTLWSDNGPLSLEDVDLSHIALVTGLDNDDPQVILGGYDDPATAEDETANLDDVMALMTQDPPENDEANTEEEDELVEMA